jgi:hypothetical protein
MLCKRKELQTLSVDHYCLQTVLFISTSTHFEIEDIIRFILFVIGFRLGEGQPEMY